MEQGRRLVIGVVGAAAMFLAAGMAFRSVGGGDDTRLATAPGAGRFGGGGDLPGIEPGEPPTLSDPVVGEGLGGIDVGPVATLPAGAATVPVAGVGTSPTAGAPSAPQPGTAPSAPAAPAFTQRGVWVVRADGSSPILVARDATSGVAAGGTWVAFVQGTTVRAVRRSALALTPYDLATGISGTAAQGLPIAGGKRGVAFLRAGKVVLVDPAAPDPPSLSYDAPAAEAVADEVDGEGRLVWADANGVHLGVPTAVTDDHVQRGMLAAGHGLVASLQGGRVAVRGGSSLGWGEIDRLRTSPAGLIAASSGRIHLRTPTGEDRLLLERASTPVATATRILYVSGGRDLASATVAGTGATIVASAGPGRALTNLELLDDGTLVVTVS